jgi:hypothetical protein
MLDTTVALMTAKQLIAQLNREGSVVVRYGVEQLMRQLSLQGVRHGKKYEQQ